MDEHKITFDDGASYEHFMGVWSRLAGDVFLKWLAPGNGWRWADVGCGNGAFTEMLIERCAPADVQGLDPSDAQLAFARERLVNTAAHFTQGDAMALPYASDAFDAAVMALVIFFVPDPAVGVAEMVRVVKPGGSVSAYAWDIVGGGFPFAAVWEEMDAMGVPPVWPPSVDASRIETMKALWEGAGMMRVETREITVERTFPNFDTFWAIAQTGPRVAPRVASMASGAADELKERVRKRLLTPDRTSITYSARANAVKGIVD